MTRAILLVSVMCGGCFIVPKTTTTRRQVGTEDGAATFVKSREVTLGAEMHERVLVVSAKRIGDCTQPVYAVDEITSEKHARLGGATDPRARAFGFILSPLTIPVSAIITGFAVAADTPKTSTTTRALGTKSFACSLEADKLTVRVTLPSGFVAERTTGVDGKVEVELPETEAYQGTATITAPTAPDLAFAYTMPKPAITTTRDAVIACASEHRVSGTVTAKLTINDSGRATRLWVSTGDSAFILCVSKQLGALRFPEHTRSSTLALPIELPTAAASL
jgi:hypothetical protein